MVGKDYEVNRSFIRREPGRNSEWGHLGVTVHEWLTMRVPCNRSPKSIHLVFRINYIYFLIETEDVHCPTLST